MNKILATIGVLAAGGGLSVCDLCGVGSSSAARASSRPRLFSVAQAATLRNGVKVGSSAETETVAPTVTMETVTLRVDGMTCGGCVYGVRKVLTRLPGVSKAEVTYEQSRAVVTYDPAAVTVAKMIAAIKTLGYTATVVARPRRSQAR